MPGPYVPPGQSPPFQVVDDLHHGAWVIIVTALGLVLSLVSFLIRLYVRLALNPSFGRDDYVFLGATAILVIQASVLFEACSKGLGTSIDLLEQSNVNSIQTLMVVSDIFYLIALYTTKCCVVGIYLRLTPQQLHNRASWGTLILCTLWVIPAIFILTVNCGLNRPWIASGGQCENLLARWQFIIALDIITELILFSLSLYLLSGLMMPMKRKLTIVLAFGFRLPVIAFAILHICSIQENMGSHDPTLDSVYSVIWGQVELNYALIACSVFCMRPFMTAVSTNYGTAGDSTLESSSREASKYNKSSASKSGGSGVRGTRLIGNETVTSGFGGLLSSVSASGGGGKETRTPVRNVPSRGTDEIELVDQRSLGSEGSAKMIIRKDVQYTVEYDGLESPDANSHHEPESWDRHRN